MAHPVALVRPPAPASDAPATADLVRAAAGGDRDAFGGLYARYAPLVHGVLLAHAPVDDVQDLVQEVFLAAMRRLDGLREPEAFGAWVAAIARNQARLHHRARRRAGARLPLGDDVPSDAPGADERLRALEILDAIRALPAAYRETLVLRLVEGMGGEEIAARTGMTHGSVRVNLHRGMRLLRERLGGGP